MYSEKNKYPDDFPYVVEYPERNNYTKRITTTKIWHPLDNTYNDYIILVKSPSTKQWIPAMGITRRDMIVLSGLPNDPDVAEITEDQYKYTDECIIITKTIKEKEYITNPIEFTGNYKLLDLPLWTTYYFNNNIS